ncbi:hypothetical protein ES703_47017 [subsurface metagenome]
MYDAYLCLRDVKPQNTPSGAFWSAAWRRRDLTEEQADPHEICTLLAHQFVLAPGTYRAMISCPAYRVNQHQARLQNVTGGATLLLGTCARAHSTAYDNSRSVIAGRFTIAAAQTLEIQHRCVTDYDSFGFGYRCNFTDEIYTIAEFWREIEEE